jgi:hypothetical protein
MYAYFLRKFLYDIRTLIYARPRVSYRDNAVRRDAGVDGSNPARGWTYVLLMGPVPVRWVVRNA